MKTALLDTIIFKGHEHDFFNHVQIIDISYSVFIEQVYMYYILLYYIINILAL